MYIHVVHVHYIANQNSVLSKQIWDLTFISCSVLVISTSKLLVPVTRYNYNYTCSDVSGLSSEYVHVHVYTCTYSYMYVYHSTQAIIFLYI